MTRFFIERPIFAWVVSIVILLLGGAAVATLPIAQYPEITPPTVTVTCLYPGASAKVVADSVAAPIEEQVNGVEKMMYMYSQCTNDGAYNLTITFQLGTDLNFAQVLVQNRVSLAMPKLPREVQVQGVTVKKKSPSILMAINFISPSGVYNDLFLSNFATIKVKDELLRIDGVGDITYLGQRDYSMRIWLDPEKLASRNLTAGDVVNAVQRQNVQVAAGQIGQEPTPQGQQFQYTMSTLGRLEEVDQFADIIIKTGQAPTEQGSASSQVVRLRDIGRIELGAQQYDQICQLDGQPSVALAVFQLPGSNALQVADEIKAKLEKLKEKFPDGVDYKIVYDTTPFILESIHEVFKTLIEAFVLVAIVVLLFLQDWKAMILPMIDVPVSLVGTFAVMALMGFTLNNITLLAMVLAIGIVVDDAIVVLENVERLIATGLDAKTATLKAMDEITGPIIGITLVLCSVLLPAAFMPGIAGQFYRQFALVIATAMIISAINAMTLTPSRAAAIFKTAEGHHEHQREALPWWGVAALGGLAALWLVSKVLNQFSLPWLSTPPHQSQVLSWVFRALIFVPAALVCIGLAKPLNRVLSVFFQWFNRGFDRVAHGYGVSVRRMLRVSAVVLVVYGGLLVATWFGMTRTPTGFVPVQDQGYLLVNVQLPDSASVQRTLAVMNKVDAISKTVPGVAHTMTISGQSFLTQANGSNFGSSFVILEDFEHRPGHDKYDEVIADKLQKLYDAQIDDAIVTIFRAPPIQGLGSAGGLKFMIEQRGSPDLKELGVSVDAVVHAGNADPRLGGLFSLYRANTPQYYLDIDRTKCESLQVNVDDAFQALQVYMGGYFVNLFNRFGRTWQVNLMADQRFRTQPESLKQLKVRNKAGDMVPLSTLLRVDAVGGPIMVPRYNTYIAAPVNANVAEGISSGQGMQAVAEICDKEGADFAWTEIAYMQSIEGSTGIYAFVLGAVLVFFVLSAQYESWNLPLAVILVVPLCLLAAIVGVNLARAPVDIFVQVGFLVLVGMAAKNAILIVEFARQKQHEGTPLLEAAVEASRLRLRPIVMTSFAFILGVVPLMIGHGAGAEMRISLGTAVFSGMLGVTIFGIFLTPLFYYVIMGRAEKRQQAAAAKPAEGPHS